MTKLGGTMTFGPNRCQYDPDGQAADPCENAAPRLVLQGANVAGTVSVSGTDWRFIHGPGTDDPVIGLYRAPAGAPAQEFYWVTDGGGRQLAVATPDGSINGTQINQLQVSGGAYAGGTSNSYGFGASRFGTADIPTMSFFRNRVYDQESGRFTQEDPIGVGGGLNLYQYAGNNPAAYTDPFGLYRCPPDCREITSQEGRAYAHEAVRLAHDYQKAGTPYVFGGGGAQGSDCIHFCHDAAVNAHLNLPLIPTADFSSDPHYKAVPVSEARQGDILWQPRDAAGSGHVGVYLGFNDKRGGLIGCEMGNSGASCHSVWGVPESKGGWFKGGDRLVVYRPLVDKE